MVKPCSRVAERKLFRRPKKYTKAEFFIFVLYWCCKYTVKVFTRKSWWDFFNRDFRFGPFWPISVTYTPTLNLENSSEHSRPATHFKAYEILNVAYCFLFVIYSKDTGENVRK